MSSKIPYNIVYCSSFDPSYPPNELENSNNNTKGWQSARFSEYPQELILNFNTMIDINQIQILSHQSKISSKIEIYISTSTNNSKHYELNYKNLEFKRLGYLSLDNNIRSNYKARELKSIFIDTKCLYLKLLIHTPHINPINLFNQIGIMAISVLGASNNNQMVVDDLSLDIQLDNITLQQIRQLNDAKVKAIKNEQYDDAKKLKNAIEALKQVGVQLSKLEKEKLKAVENEDFDRAKLLKIEIEKLRSNGMAGNVSQNNETPNPRTNNYQNNYESESNSNFRKPSKQYQPSYSHEDERDESPRPNQPSNFINRADERPLNSKRNNNFTADEPAASPPFSNRKIPVVEMDRPIKPAKKVVDFNEEEEQAPVVSKPRRSEPSFSPPLSEYNSSLKNNFDDRDERPLPTSKPNFAEATPAEDEEDPNAVAKGDPEPLTAKLEKETFQLVSVLGDMVVRGLYSKAWNHRENSLNELKDLIPDLIPDLINNHDVGSRRLFDALIPTIAKLLSDKVPQVFILATDIFNLLIFTYSNEFSKEETQRYADSLIPILIKRIEDPNQRVRQTSLKNCISIGLNKSGKISPVIINQGILKPLLKPTASSTQYESRINYLLQIIPVLGISDRMGLGVDDIMALDLLALQHKVGEVREDGIRLASQVYQIIGKKINSYLTDLKPALIDLLNKSFGNAVVSGGGMADARSEAPKANSKPPAKNTNTKSKAGTKSSKNDDEDYKVHSKADLPECEFCGLKSASFAENANPNLLDQHLFQECPILTICTYCSQVIEIPILNDHLLNECSSKDNPDQKHVQCPRCKEAIFEIELHQHLSNKKCKPAVPESVANRCPLCHNDTDENGFDGWKKHLNSCKKNPRSKSKK